MSETLKAIDDLTAMTDRIGTQHDAELEDLRGKNAELVERIEMIEANKDRPKADSRPDEHFSGFLPSGEEALILPSGTKMADVAKGKRPDVSFERWLGAVCAGEKSNDTMAREAASEAKQLVTTTSGVLIPAEYVGDWIDLLRAESVLNAAGMTTAVMSAKTQVHSAVLTDPTAGWHTEAGSISSVNPTFVAKTLSAETIVVRCQGSVELAQDSPNFGSQLAQVMTSAMAAEIDRAGLHGSGTPPVPQGLYGATGVGTVTSVGSVTNYAEMLTGVRTLLDADVGLDAATSVAIMSPRTWEVYEALATGISSDETQLERPRSLRDTNFLVTSNVSDSTTSPETGVLFMGDFRDFLMGIRSEASFKILETTNYASNLLLDFVAFARVDFIATRPASFVTLSDITI
ncbi:MAG: phage major capsid protein [Gammaproteobacteria bacterium]|nr:MAG: phage major capsid protein [Gammaproteobacteria bacterium]